MPPGWGRARPVQREWWKAEIDRHSRQGEAEKNGRQADKADRTNRALSALTTQRTAAPDQGTMRCGQHRLVGNGDGDG